MKNLIILILLAILAVIIPGNAHLVDETTYLREEVAELTDQRAKDRAIYHQAFCRGMSRIYRVTVEKRPVDMGELMRLLDFDRETEDRVY